jgi:hypothetical protein
VATKWQETRQLANATPIVALSGPLGRLQDLRQEAKAIPVAACSEHAKNLLVLSMERAIGAFLTFAGSSPEERETAKVAAGRQFQDATQKMDEFNIEMGHVKLCAPRCDWSILRAE